MLNRKNLTAAQVNHTSNLKQYINSVVAELSFIVECLLIDFRQALILKSDPYLFVAFSALVWGAFFVDNPEFLVYEYSKPRVVEENTCALLASIPYFFTEQMVVFLDAWNWLIGAGSDSTSVFVSSFKALFSNPLNDVDLSVNTDMEDLLAFLADTTEFVEQDTYYLFDALSNLSYADVALTSFIFSAAALARLPLSSVLAKFFN